MSKPAFVYSPHWYKAVTLQERAKTLSTNNKLIEPGFADNAAWKRLAVWQKQAPFDKDNCFAQRLALDGLDETQLAYLISEPIEAVQDRFPQPPDWLTTLLEAFDASEKSFVLPPPLQQSVNETFLALIRPLLYQTCCQLESGIQMLINTFPTCPFDPATIVELLLDPLPDHLLPMLNPTLVMELHIARLQGKLTGQTSEERYQSFIYQLQQPEIALAILQESPVLAQQLVAHLKNWLDTRLEFLQRLCQDAETIHHTLATPEDLGVLVALNDAAGDRHRQGRQVMIAHFSSGLRLVYKPKSLKIDIHFQLLLNWINERCKRLSFQTIRVVDCETHGWIEFISNQSCTDEAEVQRYYERIGGYIALTYLLNGTDFHQENVIAAGEHPILIDLELLLQPMQYPPEEITCQNIVDETFRDSPLFTCIIPMKSQNQPKHAQMDVSGISGSKEQVKEAVLGLEGQGTDMMRFVRKTVPLKKDKNCCRLKGHPVDPLDYIDAIIDGFSEVYNCFHNYREELLAEDSPILRCAEDEIRILIRNSESYALILRQSFQPDELRDSLRREQCFDRLWHDIVEYPRLIEAVTHEIKSLHERDICLFNTQPNSYDCWSEYGALPNVLRRSGLDVVQQRLQKLGEHDYQKQTWFIRSALATLVTGDDYQQHAPVYSIPSEVKQISPVYLINMAEEIGKRLEETAIRQEGIVSWIGPDSLNQQHWFFDYSATDLHHGLPGIALFLAYIGAATGQDHYKSLAHIAVHTMFGEIATSDITTIGGFNGWGGVIYALSHLGALWQEPELLTQAEAFVAEVLTLIEQDVHLNVVSGAAGCIVSLISLYRVAPAQQTLQAAIICGDWLIEQIDSRPAHMDTSSAIGFAHGLSGMAWALLKLYEESGKHRFLMAAQAIFRQCDETVVGTQRENHLAGSWFQGVAGLGLAHLSRGNYLDDINNKETLAHLLKETTDTGFSHNHSLGTGDLGSLEFILQARTTIFGDEANKLLEQKTAVTWQSIKSNGLLCGVPFGIETPGLINGLAGIGYGLLRLAHPDTVPSVLCLEPPRSIGG